MIIKTTLKKDREDLYNVFPINPGVYLFKQGKKILYIGKAKNLKIRLKSYFSKDIAYKTKRMMDLADGLEIRTVSIELEALFLEANLIKSYQPKYNILLKDDKTPSYIAVVKGKYPYVKLLHESDINKRNISEYFGPYLNQKDIKKALYVIKKVIPYCDHKQGKRKCISSHIGLCNPCPNGNLTSDERIKYLKNINILKKILRGNLPKVITDMNKNMLNLSKYGKFEEAALVRDKVNLLKAFKSIPPDYLEIYDPVKNEEKNLIDYLYKVSGIKHSRLKRIECFDISHLSGSFPTASMVTFVNGVADKSLYRYFKIKKGNQASDTESMKEVLARRSLHLSDWGIPDLIIVDGGKPQVSEAVKIFDKNITIGIAKRFESVVIYNGSGFIVDKIPEGSAKNLLLRIRDESHRFARTLHHKLVYKSLLNYT